MEKIMAEEWIGRKVKIISSTNPNLVGIEGEICGETLNCLQIISAAKKRKTVPKKGARALEISSGEILELGEAIVRPEERSKRLYSKIVKGK